MKSFLQANKVFFGCFVAFIILVGIPLLAIEKGDAILYFSAHRTSFGDVFFKYFTKMGEEPAYIIVIGILLFVRFRDAFLIPLLGLAVTLLSHLLKSIFAIYRPATFFKKEGIFDQINLVEGVDLYTGANSFPSGHTLSAFALYALLAFLLPQKKGIAIVLFMAAFLVGLSRVYIVQHFWQDIYVGAIVGVLLGTTFWFAQNQLSSNPQKWWNRSLSKKENVDVA